MVDLSAAISSALLINEAQWIGIIARPINYSLKGAVLHIDTGPGLKIDKSLAIEIESYVNGSKGAADTLSCISNGNDSSAAEDKKFERLSLHDGRIDFPDWASDMNSILWIPVRAINDNLARGSSSGESL